MPHRSETSNEAVVASRRAYRMHISQTFNEFSSLRALQITALLHPALETRQNCPPSSGDEQHYSARPIDFQPSQRRMKASASGTPYNPTASASIASFETQTWAQSEVSIGSSSKSSLVYVRDFPTREAPLPGWQLHFVEDEAEAYVLLQEPDRYLNHRSLRKSKKENALSWKAVIRFPTRVRIKLESVFCNKYPDC